MDIISRRSIFIARFCVHKRDDDGDTNDAFYTRDDDTGGGRGRGIVVVLFFVKVFFFFVVVVVVVFFADRIFGYERWWLSLDDFFSIGCKARVA